MAREVGLDDVVDHFRLIGNELDQLRNKSGATRLGFAVSQVPALAWTVPARAR
jgi:hypothetical protein